MISSLKKMLIFVFLMIPVLLFSQNKQGLLFQSTGTLTYESNVKSFVEGKTPSDLVNNAYFRIIQFSKAPTVEEQSLLRSAGMKFLEYIPENAFLVEIPSAFPKNNLLKTSARVVSKITPATKIEYRLTDWDIPAHAQVENNAKVAVIAMKGLEVTSFESDLANLELPIEYYGRNTRFAYLTLSKTEVLQVAQLPWVRYIEIIDEPGEKESTEGRTVQKSNLINNDLSGGLRFNAAGIGMLVRDDGNVGPHIDFQGRLNNLDTDDGGTHGDSVAGVMAAAGNLDPSAESGASGADVSVIGYEPTFQDNTLDLHLYDGVLITNSSYSNGCNAGYTTSTETVDNQTYFNPTLLHVFSAGNSNNNDCGYGAGNQWGNVTGGHKMGKNVMTTANLYEDATIVGSSSRGPAHDGRIKPDIAGHGAGQVSTDPNNAYSPFGGTSAAAPSMAGNLGQLYEAYRSFNGGVDPPSSLIKAAALNSATDLGNKGPDFIYGWGLINTGRAYDIIADNQFIFSTILQGQNNNHIINVPPGLGQLRIMVYWHDPAAAPNVTQALVNDLDLSVNGNLLPYILDHTPNPTALNTPATNGIDRLNNMEQVSIDNPAAGNYNIDISGFNVPMGPQEYVVVYSFIENDIKVTYPLGGESLIPGRTEIIHWDAFGSIGTFLVEYSTNNGTTWSSIGSVPGDQRLIDWVVPASASGLALVRVSRGGQSDVSEQTFNIFPVPSNIISGSSSQNGTTISWDPVSGATSYDVYQLGVKYMEVIGNSSVANYSLTNLQANQEYWFAVAANGNGIKGERSIAQRILITPNSICDGCQAYQTTLPSSHGFESGMGDYCNESGDDFDWRINSEDTPSNNTGPTSGAGGSNNYIYMEASNPNNPSKSAVLGGPCYDLSIYNTAGISFSYHMYGDDMGSLELEVTTDDGASWNSVWSLSGDQGDSWYSTSVDVSNYTGGLFAFRFSGLTGSDFASDIALDNISLNTGAGACNFSVGITSTDPTNGNNGSAIADISGGTGPYQYTWNNGVNTDAINNLPAGTYSVHVTDANNCVSFSSVVLEEVTPDCICNNVISLYPHIEDFENGLGDLCQETTDDFDWSIESGSTASNDTGPSGAYQGNNYFYTESSGSNYPTKVARFQSACYDLTSQNQAYIDFWYHMFGENMGTLVLEVSVDAGFTWTPIWSISEDQGDIWKNEIVYLTNYVGGLLNYRFTGTTDSDWTSDIALDQITIEVGVGCTVGAACEDNDPCTANDVFLSDCTCSGTFQDADSDTVCDANDQCPGQDDRIDLNQNGVPDCFEGPSCTCIGTISSYPHIEDFENGLGTICQSENDDFDWEVNAGGTPSSDTGPTAAYQGTNYFFTESSSPNHLSKRAQFQSSCYDLTTPTMATIDFWYHMYGEDMGILTLEVSVDTGATWASIWSLSGDQGDSWQHTTIDLSIYTGGTLLYRFTGTTSGFTSDFALDQITVDVSLGCVVGDPCDDNDVCTGNDLYDTNCNCVGTFEDDDGDMVCNANDECPGEDDGIDLNQNGIPDCVDLYVGMDNPVQETFDFDVYPNPFSEDVQITLFSTELQPNYGVLTVFNNLGQLVDRHQIDWKVRHDITLNTARWNAGVYFVQYQDDRYGLTKHVLKIE